MADAKHNNKPKELHTMGYDVEASGDDVRKHGLVELGVSIVDSKTNKVVMEFDSGLFALDKGKTWRKETVDWWKQTMPSRYDEACKATQTSAEVAAKFAKFIEDVKVNFDVTQLMPTMDTTLFDKSMINAFLADHNMPPLQTLFGSYKDVVATDSFHQAVAFVTQQDRLEWEQQHGYFSADAAVKQWWRKMEAAGYAYAGEALPWPTNEQSHRAVFDAREIAQMHNCVLNRMAIVRAMNELRRSLRAKTNAKEG